MKRNFQKGWNKKSKRKENLNNNRRINDIERIAIYFGNGPQAIVRRDNNGDNGP